MKAQIVQAVRITALLLSLAFLVNGGYEKMILGQIGEAAFSVALSALLISWSLDIAKQDKKI